MKMAKLRGGGDLGYLGHLRRNQRLRTIQMRSKKSLLEFGEVLFE